MGNEPPKDLVEVDEAGSLNSPESMNVFVDDANDLKEDSLSPPSDLGHENAGEEGWSTERTAEEPKLVVVDPYTAAPSMAEYADSITSAHDGANAARDQWGNLNPADDPFIPLPYSPTPQAESIRRSGLAWSAGIAFFGSVSFTLFLGWIVDILLGISPWGIIGGIVFGSIIGFVQFFRITSRIFPSKADGPEIRPLMSRKDDE